MGGNFAGNHKSSDGGKFCDFPPMNCVLGESRDGGKLLLGYKTAANKLGSYRLCQLELVITVRLRHSVPGEVGAGRHRDTCMRRRLSACRQSSWWIYNYDNTFSSDSELTWGEIFRPGKLQNSSDGGKMVDGGNFPLSSQRWGEIFQRFNPSNIFPPYGGKFFSWDGGKIVASKQTLKKPY